ncbi:recombinase family protein [uncultured Sphingomonas sp.]|uniref:recombinase family protein n=1 Tax=uncultured Sphingomonas sp. TaxID=158754 RepID=UPI002610E36D|nr:recombinase family protein [uncultured Sphingomonas sp.]
MSQHAIIYARFSTSEQSKGYSLERQKSTAMDFSITRGWVIEKMICDEGRSAYHGANRLEGSSLHEFELEARNGLHRGKVLVVENIDRLSRQGPRAAAQLIWGLNESGVDVATYHDGRIYRGEENSDLLDVFTLILNAQNAHQESSNKSKRTSATWEKRFEAISSGNQRAPVPHTPMWIDRIDDAYALNEHRTAVLNEIYDLYIDGVGIHRLVGILNERDEPTWTSTNRNKNGWFYSHIYRLLTKRSVLGEYVTNAGKTLATSFYPQAITAEKWNRAQAALGMRKGNQRKSKTKGNRNLLSQIVVCGQCGGGAHFAHTTDTQQTYTKVSGEVVNYRRKTYRKLRRDRARRKHSCDNGTILNYDIVEATILNQLIGLLVDQRAEKTSTNSLRENLAEMVRLRDAEQSRLENLIDALAEGGSKAIVQRVAMLENEIEQQTRDIETAGKALAIETAKPRSVDDVEAIESLRAQLTSENDEERTYARGRVNMVLRRLIKRIAINPEGTWTVEPDDLSSWIFDDQGTMLEGRYVP